MLSLRHSLEEWDKKPQISLALPLNSGRRVGLRGAQIWAIGGAADLDEAFGAAAGCTDRLAKRRAGPAPSTPPTERALLTHCRKTVSFAHSAEAGQRRRRARKIPCVVGGACQKTT